MSSFAQSMARSLALVAVLIWVPVVAQAAAVPECTVISSTGYPVVGTSVTLTTACTNSPTSYTWTGCIPSANGSACTATANTAGPASYTLVATNAAGSGSVTNLQLTWLSAAVPVCTITSAAPTGTANFGTSVTLTAVCTNTPTSYFWNGCAPIPDTASCSASSVAVRTGLYSVTARNAAGSGPMANITISWEDPNGLVPRCVIGSDQGDRPTVGSTVALTAYCSPAATNTQGWTGCTSLSPLGKCLVTATTPGLRTYTMTGSNAAGQGGPTWYQVTWQATPAATPFCSLTSSNPSPVVGETVVLTATCSGGPTSYRWWNCENGLWVCTTAATKPGVQTYTVAATNADGLGPTVELTLTWAAAGTVRKQPAVEFYHAGFSHYFITANANEIARLDSGYFTGWQRTGLTFTVLDPTEPRIGAMTPVCRFYGDPAAGLDSHFYSASQTECAEVKAKFAQWVWESDAVFQVYAVSAAGACPAGTLPLYRSWNNRKDSNHRYTTSAAVQASMVASGFIAEGYGNPPVAMCVLP